MAEMESVRSSVLCVFEDILRLEQRYRLGAHRWLESHRPGRDDRRGKGC